MEEIYILSDGTEVDLSNYSEFEKTKFLLDNPKAAKQKDTAKGAGVVSKRDKAQKAQSMGSSSVKPSSESRSKFRLPTEEEYEKYSKTQPKKSTYGAKTKTPSAYEDFYNLKAQTADKLQEVKSKPFSFEKETPPIKNTTVNNYIPKENWSTWDLIQDESGVEEQVGVVGDPKDFRLPTEEEFNKFKEIGRAHV